MEDNTPKVIKQIYILQERFNFAIHRNWKYEDVRTTEDANEAAEWKRSSSWRTYVAKDAPEEIQEETTEE